MIYHESDVQDSSFPKRISGILVRKGWQKADPNSFSVRITILTLSHPLSGWIQQETYDFLKNKKFP
jgi:hypothetical protein